MALDPWSYAKTTEHSHQAALFMWANMAMRFGTTIANSSNAYTVKGWAKEMFDIHKGPFGAVPVPQLKWLHAIHNQGHGDAVRGGKAKAEGVKAGVYDLFLPVPIFREPSQYGKFQDIPFGLLSHGLYLELKVGKGKPSEIQNEFGADMKAAGYATSVAWGWLEARKIILDYLGLPG